MIEPRNPPANVIISLEARLVLYSCIEAATKVTKISERSNEVLELAAVLNNTL